MSSAKAEALAVETSDGETLSFDPPFEVVEPETQTVPLVFNSPHSGRFYPPEFIARSRLDPVTLRRSEDSFVDEIFAAAPSCGAPLLKANFPRAFLDPNREPYELDPAMFEGPLPDHVNTSSLRVAGGLGTIARVVCDGKEIYSGKLTFDEAERRVSTLYIPYHDALRALLERTRRRFGTAILIDCHSMPSIGGPLDEDSGHTRPDIVLGDRFGTSCSGRLTGAAERALRRLDYRIARNNPYAGGFITEYYGRPREGLHALQIEINRALYMDEERVERRDGLAGLVKDMKGLVETLSAIDPSEL